MSSGQEEGLLTRLYQRHRPKGRVIFALILWILLTKKEGKFSHSSSRRNRINGVSELLGSLCCYELSLSEAREHPAGLEDRGKDKLAQRK